MATMFLFHQLSSFWAVWGRWFPLHLLRSGRPRPLLFPGASLPRDLRMSNFERRPRRRPAGLPSELRVTDRCPRPKPRPRMLSGYASAARMTERPSTFIPIPMMHPQHDCFRESWNMFMPPELLRSVLDGPWNPEAVNEFEGAVLQSLKRGLGGVCPKMSPLVTG